MAVDMLQGGDIQSRAIFKAAHNKAAATLSVGGATSAVVDGRCGMAHMSTR
jgi:hypothetical protein